MEIKSSHAAEAVSVQANSRLHFGFLDMHGGMGRLYASVGVAIKEPRTILRLQRASSNSAIGPDSERAMAICERLWPFFGGNGSLAIKMEQSIPAHSGLGSGTQLHLALASAMNLLANGKYGMDELAAISGRGKRSGVGLAIFRRGGLVLDAGKDINDHDKPPPVLSRLAFPSAWRFVLVRSKSQGLHGAMESDFFRKPPQMPGDTAARLCRLVMLKMLPAVMQKDCCAFGEALNMLQEYTGDYFATAQGGQRYTDTQTGDAVQYLLHHGATGGGQSSWGPTGFAVFADGKSARLAAQKAMRQYPANLSLSVCPASNRGAVIRKELA